MYYMAEVYIDSVVKHRFIANSIEALKMKAKPFIKDYKYTSIYVLDVKDIGYFKLSKEFEKLLKDKML